MDCKEQPHLFNFSVTSKFSLKYVVLSNEPVSFKLYDMVK